MGRPRMIIIIRHAQSEGNANRQIHQTVPDHRVKLTQEGWNQAHDAGRKLRGLLKPSDTLQFYTSPYRRTRETTDGILHTLTSDEDGPSPFPRNTIKVWEEPRLREQDFGNFQPNSAAMEKMWKERADYGHFFYRIPNGESAADAYDRVSGFNETLFRSFQEDDFPSVCVLVTHGLMTRVFLMRWYHWSVEYFEDLRNVNHCEMVVMKRSPGSGKFRMQNELRTWSELKRKAATERGEDPKRIAKAITQPPVRRKWGEHSESSSSTLEANKVPRTQQTTETTGKVDDSSSISSSQMHPARCDASVAGSSVEESNLSYEDEEEAFPNLSLDERDAAINEALGANHETSTKRLSAKSLQERLKRRQIPSFVQGGRDFGGSASGAGTPTAGSDDGADSDYFNQKKGKKPISDEDDSEFEEKATHRDKSQTPNEELKKRWTEESGMGSGTRADALGDRSELEVDCAVDDELAAAERKDKSIPGSVY